MIVNLHHIECFEVSTDRTLGVVALVCVEREPARQIARLIFADRCGLDVARVGARAQLLASGLADKIEETPHQRQDRKRMVERWVAKLMAMEPVQRTAVLGGVIRAMFPGRMADAGSPVAGTVIGVVADGFEPQAAAESPMEAA